MASGIAVTPEKLREISARMSEGATGVAAVVARLTKDVGPVRSEWAGSAQAYFNVLWDRLQKDAGGLHSVLSGMAELTRSAATAYETTEESIAKAFDEFRNDPNAAHGRALGPVAAASMNGTERSDVTETWTSGDDTAFEQSSTAEWDDVAALFDAVVPGPTETVVDDGDGTGAENAVVVDLDDPRVSDGGATADAVVSDDEDAGGKGSSQPSDSSDPSEKPKGGSRRSWTRLKAKGADDASNGPVKVEPRLRERRFKTTDRELKPGTRLCRLCFTVVVLEPQCIEATDTLTFVNCPHCGRSFPIRSSDVDGLTAAPR